MGRTAALAAIGLALGLALGLLVGWVIWPVRYTNTLPSQLRQDYRTDYILMVAAAYTVEEDPNAALERLAQLDRTNPTRPLVELAERLIAEGGRPEDLRALARLAAALDVDTPAMRPYLEGGP